MTDSITATTINASRVILARSNQNIQLIENWQKQASQKIDNFSRIILWNQHLQKWIGQTNLSPTVSSRLFYMFHLWIYQLYLWLNISNQSTILPSWMNKNWIILANLSSNKNYIYYGGSILLSKYFSNNSEILEEIETTSQTTHNSDLIDQPFYIEWIQNMTNQFYENIQLDYSAQSTNPTWTTSYTPPSQPNNGQWRPNLDPTGSYLNPSWNIPCVNESDLTSYIVQNYVTPNWGGVQGYEWNRVESFPIEIENILQKYVPNITNSDILQEEMNQVVQIQSNLTNRQKAIAEFWEAGKNTAKPPGIWNWITRNVCLSNGYNEETIMKCFFGLNSCLMNSFIIAWDIKRMFEGERPITYLRRELDGQIFKGWRGIYEGFGSIDTTQPYEEFLPYQNPLTPTPPFPGFISGHSTCSSSAGTFLEYFTGSLKLSKQMKCLIENDLNVKYGNMNPLGVFRFDKNKIQYENPDKLSSDIILQWPTWQDAVQEAGMSRLYGGIHVITDHLGGVEIGKWMANYTIQKLKETGTF